MRQNCHTLAFDTDLGNISNLERYVDNPPKKHLVNIPYFNIILAPAYGLNISSLYEHEFSIPRLFPQLGRDLFARHSPPSYHMFWGGPGTFQTLHNHAIPAHASVVKGRKVLLFAAKHTKKVDAQQKQLIELVRSQVFIASFAPTSWFP